MPNQNKFLGQIDIAYGNWNGPHRLFLQERINNNINGYEDDVQNEKIKFKVHSTYLHFNLDFLKH